MDKKKLFLFIIIFLFLILGVFFSFKVNDFINISNKNYKNAILIENEKEFKEFLNNKKGNAFVYGPLDAINGVTLPVLDDNYISIKKEHYEYVYVKKSTTNKIAGYQWKFKDSEEFNVNKVSFLGQEFYLKDFDLPKTQQVYEEMIDSKNKYIYEVILSHYDGTLYLSFNSSGQLQFLDFMEDTFILDAYNSKQSNSFVFICLFWIIYISALYSGFYLIKNFLKKYKFC